MLATIGIVVKEPWAVDISYEMLNYTLYAVEAGGDGCGYIALKDNIGVTPGSDETVWRKAVQAGQSIYDLAVKYHHFVGTEEEFEAQYQAALQAALDAAASATAAEAQVEAAEALRVQAESSRESAETARAAAESARATAEDSRDTAESGRVSAESSRASAETGRSEAETARHTAETTRQSNEEEREEAEGTRTQQFEALKADMQVAIGQADAAATAATEAAASAAQTESDIEAAEASRVTAEQGRVTAEQGRATAEQGRVSAESSRVTAESARETQAGADHTRAEGDHTQAGADHTQAVSDHTRAESDHSRAESDHTQAAADHTQAGSDHAVVEGYDTRLTNVEGEVSQLGQDVAELQDNMDALVGESEELIATVVSSSYVNYLGEIITGDSSWKLFKFALPDVPYLDVTVGTPAAQLTPHCAFYSDSGYTQLVGTPIATSTLAGKTTTIPVPEGAHYFAGSVVFNIVINASAKSAGRIDGIDSNIKNLLDISQLRGYYTCTSEANATLKTISGDYLNLSLLTTGSHFLVKMTNALTASFAEFNINNLGAKRIWYNGAAANARNSWHEGEMLDIYYDGTQFQAVNYNNSILVNSVSSVKTIFDKTGFVGKNGVIYSVAGYKMTGYIPYFVGNKYKVRGLNGSSDITSPAICNFYDENKTLIGYYSPEITGNIEAIIDDTIVPSGTMYFVVNSTSGNGFVEALSTYDVLRELYRFDDALDGRIDKVSGLLIKANNWEQSAKTREDSLRQAFIDSGAAEHWYGVEWSEESDPDNVTPIYSTGDSSLHTTLPIQNKMRRCVVKDGIVQYYLDANNSELKADGSAAKLDGTDGNVMVEIPEFFYRCEESLVSNVKTVRLKISEQGLPGFLFSRKVYTSAYEATIDRTNNVLASVCTTLFSRSTQEVMSEGEGSYIDGNVYSYGQQKTAVRNGFTSNATNFRGGTNDSTLDSETNPAETNYSRNQLGIPVSNINREDARNYADKDNNLFMDQYDTQKKLWILAQVEFKTRNIQKPIASGGLGKGATVYPDYAAYEAFFQPQRGIACLPCGITNSLGNNSGEVYYKMVNVPVSSIGTGEEIVYNRFADVWMPVMSYRGVENMYGHIYKIVDGVNVRVTNVNEYVPGHSGESLWQLSNHTYYYQPNPFLTNNLENEDESLGTYKFASNVMSVSQLLLGSKAHILHIGTDGKNMEGNYCDCSELLANTRLEFITFNGRIVSGSLVGFHFIVAADAANGFSTRPSDGVRINMF